MSADSMKIINGEQVDCLLLVRSVWWQRCFDHMSHDQVVGKLSNEIESLKIKPSQGKHFSPPILPFNLQKIIFSGNLTNRWEESAIKLVDGRCK